MQIMGLLALKGLKLAPKPPDYKDQILSIYMHWTKRLPSKVKAGT